MTRNKNYKIRANLLQHLLFANRCRICGKIINIGAGTCDDCSVEKLRIPEKAIENQVVANKHFDAFTSPFYYSGDVRKCIHNLKYNGYKRAAEFLASEMIEVIERDFINQNPDFVTCVPMHKNRKREKGYNQCDFLIKHISKAFSLNQAPKLLVKIKDTPTQVNLDLKERTTNLKGAFEVNKKFDVKGKTVLLCDDVRTTGSTLDECAKTLKKAGAKKVFCVTCAINDKDL